MQEKTLSGTGAKNTGLKGDKQDWKKSLNDTCLKRSKKRGPRDLLRALQKEQLKIFLFESTL